MSEMCCMQLAGNTGRKNDAKNSHLRTIGQICRDVSSQPRHVSTIRKKLVKSNTSSTCSHNMANFGPLAAEICWRAWGTPANFNGFRVWLRYCSDVAHRRPTKLCTMLGHFRAGTLYIDFRGLLPLTEFCHVQNSLYVQVMRSPILAALMHGTPAAGVSETLRHGTRNGITELSQSCYGRPM